ncbi:MAG: 2-hydroxyacid dehydrogenase [Bdellovibrionia bacterium]
MAKQKPRIVLTYPIHCDVIENELKPYAHVDLIVDPKKLPKALQNADGLITLLTQPVTDSLLANAPRLRVVGNMAIGVDNIDLKACAKRGIQVVNTPDVLTRATAELAITLLFAAAKRVPEGEALCRQGKFKGWEPDMLLGLELKGRKAVLVGKGRIGHETGKMMQALGLKVDYITRKDSPAVIEKKLKQAQVLSLHAPYNASTKHWLNQQRIALLPKDAIVINTARGPVIDEKALIQALQKKRIFAAGLDVYEKEPQIPNSLRKLPNVVLLPHVGSATRETREAMARLVVQGTLGVLSGKRVPNTVKFQG